jgi:type I restriction enzyme R subunit
MEGEAGPSPFFDPRAPIDIHERNLPHWQQEGVFYFLTWRLADALPQARLRAWECERAAWLRLHPPPWDEETNAEYHREFPGRIEQWLDAGAGSCLLKQSNLAAVVASCLRHFDRQRYELRAFVVMPNHVHVVARIFSGQRVEKIVQSWKGYAARTINAAMSRTGTVWQEGYWDRIVRHERHLWRCLEYIRNNPVEAKLRPGEYALFVQT